MNDSMLREQLVALLQGGGAHARLEDVVRQFPASLAGSRVGSIADPQTELLAPLPPGQGQTVLREALLVADHNSYHLGQLSALRRGLEG
ncbi:MAG: hypothetical protein ACYS0G_05820 [Planctomycetota bacterium]